jgi:small-conductance mechanosensitive channel
MGVPKRFAVAVAALALWTPLAAQAEPPAEAGADYAAAAATALVRVDGRPILQVRGVAGFPAAERARGIEQRIVEIAADPGIPADAIELRENPRGTAVVMGGRTILTVTDADAEIEELNRQELAGTLLATLPRAIQSWRYERSPERRLRNAYVTLGATAALVAVLWLLAALSRYARRYFEQRVAARVKSIGVQSFEVVDANQIKRAMTTLPRIAWWLAVAAALYAYLDFILQLFPLTRPLGERLFWLVATPLQTMGLALLRELPNLFFLVVLAVVTRYVLRLIRLYFAAIERGAVKLARFEPEWAIPTYKVLRIFVIAFALVVAYPYIPGSDSAAFKGVSVLLGLLFSLGSSSIIANVIAGYSMTYRRAFRTGDRIRVGEIVGEVLESRVLVTTLRTPKNEVVVVPNTELMNTSVLNYSALARDSGLILHTTVGIGYETPWRQVEAMLLMAADRTPGLKRDPRPFVLQRALGDFCVTYEINAYTGDPNTMLQQYSSLHANILDVFNEYGVQIMTPAYEGDPPEPKIVPAEHWHAAPAQPPAEARAEPRVQQAGSTDPVGPAYPGP